MLKRPSRTLRLAVFMSLTIASAAMAQDTRDAELNSSDQELKRIYKSVMKRLDIEGQQHLKFAQRAWIQMRDADCEWSFVDRRDCLMDRIDQRTTQLKETYFQDKNGNYGSLDSAN